MLIASRIPQGLLLCPVTLAVAGSLPFAAPVCGAHRTRHWRSIQVACKLWVRNTHLQGQVFTQLEAVVTKGGKGQTRELKREGK